MNYDRDLDHLKLLSWGSYIHGGLLALFSCFALVYVFMGLVFASIPAARSQDMPPRIVGIMFMLIGSAIVAVGWTLGGLTIYAGRCLSQRKHYLFCNVMAGLGCIFIPYGTLLGVCAIIVLQRERVKAMFQPTAISS